MSQRLATQIRKQLSSLVDQYDGRLRVVPGYANLPEPVRRDLEQQVLQITAECLEANDASRLIQYIRERAEQVLAHGFQPEWFQQAVTIPQEIITPLVKTVEESNFVWRSLGQAQTAAWEIVAQERRRIELTLRESETRYQTIFDSTPVMFWLKDTHNRTLRINKAAAELEGVQPAEVEGKSAYDLYPREQAEAFYQDDLEVIRSNKPKLGIIEQHTSVGTGEMMWLETGKTPVHNDQGEVIGVLAFAIDVTERKRLEHEFQASLERRSRQVQTSTEVAQHIAAAPGLEELFHRVVTLIKERFTYYHVQLFHYEPAEDVVKLITGYGEIGQKMLAAGHQLAMGRGVVGTAAATGQSILAADVARDLDWRPNPNLPNTRGELAVPIKLGGGDAESQVNALKYFVNSGYDGLAITAIDPEAVARITHESLQRGKPVVAVSTDLGKDNQTALVYAVEHELGYLLGLQAGTWVKEHLPGDHNVKIGMLNYRALPQVLQREMGIIDGIQSVIGERVTVVASGSAVESKEAAYLAEGWLRDHPDLNMIVAYNDATALGAYQAAQALGRHDPDQFFIGGIDAVPEALTAIQQGGVYQATVNQPPEIMGMMAVRMLVAAIKGIPVEPVHTIYCAPVNRSNVAQFSDPSRAGDLLANQDIIPAETLSGLDVSGLRLGLSVLTLANPFFASLVAGARQEAQRLGVQLVVNDPSRVLGVLDVQSDRANSLSDDDRLLLEGMCGQIAIVMESTRLLEQLRRSEAELSEALKLAKLAHWEYDVANDQFIFNDQFYSIFHTTAEQAGGYRLSSAQYAQRFVHPDDLPMVGTEIEKALNSTDRHYTRLLEHRILYADGGVGYISVNVNIDRDEEGRILRYYGANQDITESKLAEQAIREEQQRTRTILETISIPTIISRLSDSEVLYANEALAQIRHMDLDKLIGSRTTDYFVIPDDRNKLVEILRRQGYATDFETQLRGSGGVVSWVLLSARIINFQNETCVLSTYVDITQRKQAEQRMAETLRETERLYAAISRESWQTYRQTGSLGEGYLFDRTLIQAADNVWEPEIAQALAERALVTSQSGQRAVAVTPLSVRGEAIGALGVYDDPTHPLSQEDLQLIETVAEQLALALEGARLFDQNQRDAEREHTINRVTSRIRNARSVDEVLSIAAQELRLATRASRSVVEILPAGDQAPRSGNGEGVKA